VAVHLVAIVISLKSLNSLSMVLGILNMGMVLGIVWTRATAPWSIWWQIYESIDQQRLCGQASVQTLTFLYTVLAVRTKAISLGHSTKSSAGLIHVFCVHFLWPRNFCVYTVYISCGHVASVCTLCSASQGKWRCPCGWSQPRLCWAAQFMSKWHAGRTTKWGSSTFN